MTRTILQAAGSLMAALLMIPAVSAAEQCGDPGDLFAVFYGEQGVGKEWHVSMVTPDHEDHGLHLVEGDSFTLMAGETCEVVLIPGATLQQRWGPDHQQLGRENKALDPYTISNELCTTMSVGHGHSASGSVIARPHLVRMRMLGDEASPYIEIRYGHRSTMADDCSNDGLLDGIHGGTAHAEN